VKGCKWIFRLLGEIGFLTKIWTSRRSHFIAGCHTIGHLWMNCTNPKTSVERKQKVLAKKVFIGSNLEASLDKVE
jgi:hypothetical protein